jgi:hypothetical protein
MLKIAIKEKFFPPFKQFFLKQLKVNWSQWPPIKKSIGFVNKNTLHALLIGLTIRYTLYNLFFNYFFIRVVKLCEFFCVVMKRIVRLLNFFLITIFFASNCYLYCIAFNVCFIAFSLWSIQELNHILLLRKA